MSFKLNQGHPDGQKILFVTRMVFDIPESSDPDVRQANLENWIATRTDIANNLASLIGNINLNYDLS